MNKGESDQVDIVLSTYNGDAYLEQQLESILSQSHPNWKLWIRDDGSKDNTLNIIHDYIKKHSRIHLIQQNKSDNLGPVQSFSKLMQHALSEKAQIISFCDQDDCWHTDKVKITYENMKDRTEPCLFFSDLTLCNQKLEPQNSSYLEFMNFSPLHSKDKLKHLLCQNFIVGCTTSINAELAKLCAVVPNHALMHDWWAALVCLTNKGHIEYCSQKLVQYRSHPNNASGAGKKKSILDFLRNDLLNKDLFNDRIKQAHALISSAQTHHNTIIDFIEVMSKSGVSNAIKFHQKGFCFQGAKRQIAALTKLAIKQ